MKLLVRSGGADESGIQPAAVIVLDIRLPLLLLLASLKFGSLKRIFVVCGRFGGRFSDSLGTAAEGRRGFCLVAAVVAAGGGGRGCGWKKEGGLSVLFDRGENEEVRDVV
jgi:hypothetical protein